MSDVQEQTRQRLPRGRRGAAAILVAVLLLVLAALATTAALQIHYGHDATVLGSVHGFTHWLHRRRFDSVAALSIGVLLAAAGLVVLLAGLLPAPRRMLRLADPDARTIVGIDRSGLEHDLGTVAARVDGVVSARAKVAGRRRVVVEARSAMRDRSGLADAVQGAVTERVAELQPARELRVRTRIAGSRA